ncbi:predicted protein [Naegleria gruberi]|uniref:Predicted protein n=1 Tax=Naegleria gruberi TaxID=5762 RepID=D2VN96_NAEGR|nr:uncharacterized protein NAEGRDRAFT_50949 [Naegleria gruberi]EFC41704.1 predicted protein [Naegleria gruberi]|eukprot:XP_002674448.1 predicted protein [Naegleria gruberi strain NEG-M]
MEKVVKFFRDIDDCFRKKKRTRSVFYRCSYDTAIIVKQLFSKNQELFKSIMKKTRGEVLYLSSLDKEIEVLEVAVECSIRKLAILGFGDDVLRDNGDFVKKCVKLNGLNLRDASHRLQSDYKIALAAVKQNGKSLKYVNSSILTKDLVKTALIQNPKSIVFVRNYVYNNMRDDFGIVNLIQRFLTAQHVCRTRSWSRSFMYERIFAGRMVFRRKYSISYEETNKQEIKLWGEPVSNINGLLSFIEKYENFMNPKPRVVCEETEVEYDELGELNLFCE